MFQKYTLFIKEIIYGIYFINNLFILFTLWIFNIINYLLNIDFFLKQIFKFNNLILYQIYFSHINDISIYMFNYITILFHLFLGKRNKNYILLGFYFIIYLYIIL